MPDSEIVMAIEGEFISDDAVPFNDIDVNANEGIVELSGSVDNLLAKKRATLIAETIKGVRAVSNRIDVEPNNDLNASQLRRRVRDALLFDSVTESYEVEVAASSEGVVTLEGEVDSQQEKRFAERVAAGVDGVSHIKNNIEVDTPPGRVDEEIEREVARALEWNTLVDSAYISVNVEDGYVRLVGSVGSVAEKRHADRTAWVRGVVDVDTSKLEVSEVAPEDEAIQDKAYSVKSDGEIKTAIQDAFRYDPRIDRSNVDIFVDEGDVLLRGTVDNLRAKEAAETLARHTDRVNEVDNFLKVRPETARNDEEIEDIAEDGLRNNAWVSLEDIALSVDNNTARLSGTVETLFEKAQAESVIQGITGITSIKNLIKVADTKSIVVYDPYVWSYYPYPWTYYNTPRPVTAEIFGAKKSDEATAADIAKELYWSPFVNHENITIVVEEGTAILTGSVDSKKEKDAATENALEGGALNVKNRLIIES